MIDDACAFISVYCITELRAVEVRIRGRHDSRKLVRRMRRFISHATPEQLEAIPGQLFDLVELADLRRHEIHLVNAVDGSVYLYFWCRTREAVPCLMEWIDSGQLAAAIEKLINLATAGEENLSVSCLLINKTSRRGKGTCMPDQSWLQVHFFRPDPTRQSVANF